MAELAVTAIGVDQPGIVAAVAKVLQERGGNVEDSAMTILRGHFAMMLLVEIDDRADHLAGALREATAALDLQISVSDVAPGAETASPTHVLSVYGGDKPGIIATVSAALADAGANVTDLETRLLGGDTPVYAMIVEVAVDDEATLAARIAEACDGIGVDHTLRALETETY